MRTILLVLGIHFIVPAEAAGQMDTVQRKEKDKMKHSTIRRRSIRGNDSIPWYDTPVHKRNGEPMRRRGKRQRHK